MRIAPLPVSATNAVPPAPTATPKGKLNRALVPTASRYPALFPQVVASTQPRPPARTSTAPLARATTRITLLPQSATSKTVPFTATPAGPLNSALLPTPFA